MISTWATYTFLLILMGIVLTQFFPSYKNNGQDHFFVIKPQWTIWHAVIVLLIDATSTILLNTYIINAFKDLINPFWSRFLIPLWIFGILFLFFRLSNHSIRSVGLTRENFKTNFLLGVKIFLVAVIVLNVLFALSPDLGSRFKEIEEGWREKIATHGTLLPYAGIFISCLFIFFYALQEEIIFRGLLYGATRQHLSPLPSILLNACLFTIMHNDLSVVIFLLGIVLSYLYEKLRTLWPIVFFHSMYNGYLMIHHAVGIPVDLTPLAYHLLTALGSLVILIILKVAFPKTKLPFTVFRD